MQKPLVQWSLKELVVVLTLFMVVGGAMWAPPIIHHLAMVMVMLVGFALLIVALCGRGERRVFGIGFSTCTLGYFLLIAVGEASVGDETPLVRLPFERLPTSELWEQLQSPITHVVYYRDGKPIPASLEPTMQQWGEVTDAQGNVLGRIDVGGGFVGGGNAVGPVISMSVTPGDEIFHTTGYALWMLLLGYLGGKFAVGFRRYQNRHSSTE